MKKFLERLKRMHWNRLIPVITILMGYSSCAICGGDTDTQGKNVCYQMAVGKVTGLAYGPLTVTFTAAPLGYIDTYRIRITDSKSELLGYAEIPGSQPPVNGQLTASNIQMNAKLVDQEMAGARGFGIEIQGSLSAGPLGECETDGSIYLPAQKNKSAPLKPEPTTPPPPAPPAPPPPATLTPVPKIPHLIIPLPVATCPPGHYLPPACPEIPR